MNPYWTIQTRKIKVCNSTLVMTVYKKTSKLAAKYIN